MFASKVQMQALCREIVERSQRDRLHVIRLLYEKISKIRVPSFLNELNRFKEIQIVVIHGRQSLCAKDPDHLE
jgi:hypothetical protein